MGTYTYQPALGLDQRSVLTVHLVVEATSVAEVMTGAVPSPQRRRRRSTVDALTTFCVNKQIPLYNSNESNRVNVIKKQERDD